MIQEIRKARIFLADLEQQVEDVINQATAIQQENAQLKSDLFALQQENKKLKEDISNFTKKENEDGEGNN